VKRKLILMTDLDGTLLDENKTVSEENLEAIRAFRKKGGSLSLATGRTIEATKPYLDLLLPDAPCVFYNGSLIRDFSRKETLMTAALPESADTMVRKILAAFPEAAADIITEKASYAQQSNEWSERLFEICRETPVRCDYESVPKRRLKVLFTADPAVIDKIEVFVREQGEAATAGLHLVRSEPYYYEMLPEGVTKGRGVEVIRDHFRKKGEKALICAAGDFDNDIEMLEAADFSAAPANAGERVKQAADIVLKESCGENAISRFIAEIEKNMG
jgi:Cof subfamily protein (haloacid dehalogenase superfamily)